jgi:hypothetical protein
MVSICEVSALDHISQSTGSDTLFEFRKLCISVRLFDEHSVLFIYLHVGFSDGDGGPDVDCA